MGATSARTGENAEHSEIGEPSETAERLARLATWIRRLSRGVGLAYGVGIGLVAVYVFLVVDLLPAVGVLAVLFVTDLPLLRVRVDGVYRTDASPEAVREQFGSVLNPALWGWLAWLDPEHPAAEPGRRVETAGSDPPTGTPEAVARVEDGPDANPEESVVAVATVSSLVGSATEVTLTREPLAGGDIRLRARAGRSPRQSTSPSSRPAAGRGSQCGSARSGRDCDSY